MDIYHRRVYVLVSGKLLNVLEPDALLSKDGEGRMSKGVRAQSLILPRDLRLLDVLRYHILDSLHRKGLVEPVPAYHKITGVPVIDEGQENRQVSGNIYPLGLYGVDPGVKGLKRPTVQNDRRFRPVLEAALSGHDPNLLLTLYSLSFKVLVPEPGYLVCPEAVYEKDKEHGIITLADLGLPVWQLQEPLGLGRGKDGTVPLVLLREDELQLLKDDRVLELPVLLLDEFKKPVQGNELVPDGSILVAFLFPEVVPVSKGIRPGDVKRSLPAQAKKSLIRFS